MVDLEFCASLGIAYKIFAAAWLVATSAVAAGVILAEAHAATPREADAECAMDKCFQPHEFAAWPANIMVDDIAMKLCELLNMQLTCCDDDICVLREKLHAAPIRDIRLHGDVYWQA